MSLALGVPTLTGFATTALADDEVPPALRTAVAPVAATAPGQKGAPASVSGEVTRYVVGPLGHVRAFTMKDGTVVSLRGTAGDAMAKQVPVGQLVRVEGFTSAGGGKEVRHAAVFGQHGQVVTPPARGEGKRDPAAWKAERKQEREEIARLGDAQANGTVESVIQGHHGKPVAVVLTNGLSVFLSPSLAREVASRGVRVGDKITSSGKGATYPVGASVFVRSIAFADGTHFEARSRHGAQAG